MTIKPCGGIEEAMEPALLTAGEGGFVWADKDCMESLLAPFPRGKPVFHFNVGGRRTESKYWHKYCPFQLHDMEGEYKPCDTYNTHATGVETVNRVRKEQHEIRNQF